jgi:hypothetical protein
MNIMQSLKRILLSVTAFTFLSSALAAIVVPGASGSDGPLDITTDTVIDLSKAGTGAWDSNIATNSGNGVYDPEKWAVVFKYSSVTIRSNATVTFRNHPSRAPVVWLVSGDVVIQGSVQLNGENSKRAPFISEPGPGGFRGGQGNYAQGLLSGSGFGPGGGDYYVNWVTAANYSEVGPRTQDPRGSRSVTPAYGNPSLLQLVGGSGGSGSSANRYQAPFTDWQEGGAGGGGAILIAAETTVKLNGRLSCNGGSAVLGGDQWAGAGSGGAVRIVCSTLDGRGLVEAVGGTGKGAAGGGAGRIRVERVETVETIEHKVGFSPDPSTVTLVPGHVALLWPREADPSVRILSIGERSVSSDPRAGFGAFGPDVALALTNRTFVSVETRNVETNSQVIVRLTPRANGTSLEVNAGLVGSDAGALRWLAELPVKPGYSAVQVRVVRP